MLVAWVNVKNACSTMLGKRKRDVGVATRHRLRSPDDRDGDQAVAIPFAGDRDIFRKYFESTFEPLPETETTTLPPQETGGEDDGQEGDAECAEEESEWGGLSDSELEDAAIEIVEHRAASDLAEEAGARRQHYKTFMSSRPPKETERAARRGPVKQAEEEDAAEGLNLKHDLDLQRLLKESHLLEQAKASSTLGTHRHKVVDMRMQALGSKGSMFQQEKMPLAHRRGILAKAADREASRRREAQENGIILEKAAGKSRSKDSRRERGVDVPAVGRFRGGTLTLSKKDVFDIQGQGISRPRGKKRRR
ncbi:uncharacterized protein PV07_06490 [Cladophialophora immunda]|uniref:Uncharacterized protein n=1 Tax=Cladophialophora immunda TaxID=569365 RepID=A0A0D2C866_9EURO|nr:uncharacterized protein PV07_06490 [Cladophialophora immunda]KIW26675.1 hypothetical protein PV07_06490 [Cladophialophora immunda]OQV01938.1 hypothetical protein CLAIMM_07211 [Cladophialophora immunda]